MGPQSIPKQTETYQRKPKNGTSTSRIQQKQLGQLIPVGAKGSKFFHGNSTETTVIRVAMAKLAKHQNALGQSLGVPFLCVLFGQKMAALFRGIPPWAARCSSPSMALIGPLTGRRAIAGGSTSAGPNGA